jgi:hypothetical protein
VAGTCLCQPSLGDIVLSRSDKSSVSEPTRLEKTHAPSGLLWCATCTSIAAVSLCCMSHGWSRRTRTRTLKMGMRSKLKAKQNLSQVGYLASSPCFDTLKLTQLLARSYCYFPAEPEPAPPTPPREPTPPPSPSPSPEPTGPKENEWVTLPNGKRGIKCTCGRIFSSGQALGGHRGKCKVRYRDKP